MAKPRLEPGPQYGPLPHTILPPFGAPHEGADWKGSDRCLWPPHHIHVQILPLEDRLSHLTAWHPSPTNQPQGQASKTTADVPPKEEDKLPLPQMQNSQWEKRKFGLSTNQWTNVYKINRKGWPTLPLGVVKVSTSPAPLLIPVLAYCPGRCRDLGKDMVGIMERVQLSGAL